MKKFLSIIFATIILTGCTSENTVDIDYKSISTDTDIISEEHKITYEYKPITNFKNGVAWVMATSENGTPLDIKASTHEEMASTKNSTSNIKYFMINTK